MTETQNPEASAPEPEPVAEQASAPLGTGSTAQPGQPAQSAPPAAQLTVEELGVPASPSYGYGVPATPAVPAEQKPKRRVRGRTLFTGALVLGVLGGAGTGYAVQASRPATPLPPLAATQPKYAPAGVYQGVAPATLPAAQDDATRTEGPLTKLLIPKPPGASDGDSFYVSGPVSPDQDAYYCDDQVTCYKQDFTQGVEAIADITWLESSGTFVDIRMYRYRPGDSDTARSQQSDFSADAGSALPLPAGVDVQGYEYQDSEGYWDFAAALHGDILVEFTVNSISKNPDPSLIDGLITQQMGRL
jgi:hypothetical protein